VASPKAITSPVGDISNDEQYPVTGTYNNMLYLKNKKNINYDKKEKDGDLLFF